MDENRLKTGLITYHAAYNFGAVLQAFALQQTLDKIGIPNEIIDYQTKGEINAYHHDLHFNNIRNILASAGFVFYRKARKKRAQKFASFIADYMRLTPRRYTTYAEIHNENFMYENLLSGSDQIWNIDCGEFQGETPEAILPYFLDFAHPKKKISYASSIGDTHQLNYVKRYLPYLSQFDALSVREPRACRLIGKATGKSVELVVDPTWLLARDEWQIDGTYCPQTNKRYILCYILYWMPWKMKQWLKAIKSFARRFNFDVYCISPMNCYFDNEVHWLHDAGPLDFLSYMNHASLVITNTFHGTIFPMNFNVPFYSCNVLQGTRQGHILATCDLEERILNSPLELYEITDYACDFTTPDTIIKGLRNKSLDWLKSVL